MIEPINGQSVKFLLGDETDFNTRNSECTGDLNEYCSYVAKGMQTSLQLKMLPTTGTQLLTNPEFQTNANDWTNATWSSEYGGSITTNAILFAQQAVSIDTESYYYIEAKFRDVELEPGQLFPLGSELLPSGVVYTGSSSREASGDRIARVWFYSDQETSTTIKARILGSGYIEYIRMVELTIPTIEVKDSTDTTVLTPSVRFYEDRAIASVNWEDITADTGKFTICAQPYGDTSNNLVANQGALVDNNGNLVVDNFGVAINVI